MIRTRLWVGTLLALGAAGVLVGDTLLADRGFALFPFLLAFLLLAGTLGARELVRLFPAAARPSEPLVTGGVLLVLAANWYPAAQVRFGTVAASAWEAAAVAFAGVQIGAFLLEMWRYNGEPGAAVPRLALTAFAVAYLGLLPCFFVQVRWLAADAGRSAVMLALVVFVPKGNDIGAFFTGTFVGRHKMVPALSPKKTWEGFAGGMLAGAGVAAAVAAVGPVFGTGEAVAFGLAVGLAGVAGDLAESLVKRDGRTKDASRTVPGFGGVLDVVDSVLFAAPVAYLWFRIGLSG